MLTLDILSASNEELEEAYFDETTNDIDKFLISQELERRDSYDP